MKVKNQIICLFFLIAFSSFAQNFKPNNSILLNLGAGTFASIDYERNWNLKKSKHLLFVSAGVGAGREGKVWMLINDIESPDWYFVTTQKATYCVGNGINFLELGLGGIYVAGNTTQPFITYPILGYRYIGKNNTTFKIYFSQPFSGIKTDDLGFFPFGIGFGQFF